MPSPTALSLRLLRASHYACDVVERFIAPIQRRRDCLGIADIIAARRGEPGALLVQATTLGNISSRLKKAKSRATLGVWLASGGRYEVWGWYLRDGRWQVKRVAVTPEDLQGVVIEGPQPRRKRKGERQRSLFE